MTTVRVFKDADGRLRGVTAEDERNQRRWKKYIDSLAHMDQAEYEIKIPRDPAQHNKFMRMVGMLLERTEAFTDRDSLRKWITIGAGYMEQDGSGAWVAKSLAFDAMDGIEFAEFFRRAEDFLHSDRARQGLWRHLNAHQHAENIRQLLEGGQT
jgi:Protein of unknown function (DUF1367)